MSKLWLIIISLAYILTGEASPPHSFSLAKKIATQIFGHHKVTLYCQCTYEDLHNTHLKSCNMSSAMPHKRAHQVEWEHITPASKLAEGHACWTHNLCFTQKGKAYHGRKCCEKIDPNFIAAESELYNLWPSIGLINQLRLNYDYAQLHKHQSNYGCTFYIDRLKREVEPNDLVKGIVARATLFMAYKYGVRLSHKQKQLLLQWDEQMPPSTWEVAWAEQVEQYEGYPNPYISHHQPS